VSELIHKSKNFPNLQYAKVTVFFQMIYEDHEGTDAPEGGSTGDSAVDSDAFEVVPDSHFVVSRVAGKDNSSKYTVDGKNATYTEVGKLLRKVGIDLDNNRFLILQGEVEQIAMMKPKGATQHDEGNTRPVLTQIKAPTD
jgi:structural maintenance of chromosome 4